MPRGAHRSQSPSSAPLRELLLLSELPSRGACFATGLASVVAELYPPEAALFHCYCAALCSGRLGAGMAV